MWEEAEGVELSPQQLLFSCVAREVIFPRDELSWAGPSVCPPLPLHALLRLPKDSEGDEWAVVGYFRAFLAILGSSCEPLRAGRKRQALVSALKAMLELVMQMVGVGQGGRKL